MRTHGDRRTLWVGLLMTLLWHFSLQASEQGTIFAGTDANYSLGMEKDGREWRWNGTKEDLFQGMANRGVRGLRVRLWTGEDGQNGKSYASEVVKRALKAGLEPYLVIFLSEDWADLMKQPLPAVWKDLDIDARAVAVRTYSRDVVKHFRQIGLKSHLYEIGNEIDYGICGVYPGKSTKKSPASLGRSCWPDAAKLIIASQQGVKEADPEARFLLHIAHWWDVDFCIGFFRFMIDHGVQVDYAGLSYFPSSNIGGSLQFEQFGEVVSRLHKAISRPVIVPETAYPDTADFKGQFSRWKKEAPGYPLTPDGQKRWLADFLAFCAHHPAIDSVYYWSPEWCGEGMWKAFALFDVDGNAKPAWDSFALGQTNPPAPKRPVYFEIDSEHLYPIPLEESKRQARLILDEKFKQFGGVNTDYIKAITETGLVVDGYRVNLRSSLSGNIDLTRDGKGQPAQWQEALAKIDVANERVVLFAPEEMPALLKTVQEFADSRRLEMIVHPKPPGSALKFGMDVKSPVEPAAE